MSGTVRFKLARKRRTRALRAGAVLVAVGLALFVTSLSARRGGADSALFAVGLAGALAVAVGLRRILQGRRPLVVTDRYVMMASRVIPLQRLQAVEAQGETLQLVRDDGAVVTEEIQGAELAAVEVARRAGFPPPRKGEAGQRVRYERKAPP